jgi:hypothetical protein
VYRDCVTTHLVVGTFAGLVGDWLGHHATVPAGGPIGYTSCTRIADAATVGWVTGLGGLAGPAVPTVDVLVAQARANLVIALPDVATSPPRGGTQLVAVPVWFWVENFEPVGATAAIPGLSATLTATPTTTTVRTGDGTTVTCDGPGVAYDQTRSWRDQHSDCSHPFIDRGPVTVDVTVTWSLAWTASDGQAGTLPAVARTTTFDLTIEEAQAVTD